MLSTQSPVGIGVVGCGNISRAYFSGLRRFPGLRVAGCTDLDRNLRDAAGDRHRVRVFDSVAELAASNEVEIVVNLTPPLAHFDTSQALIEAGKHVFTEKPLTASFESAKPLVELAAKRGVLLASAPDTFLGASGQTARAVVDEGLIGEVIGATAFVTHSKAELWHPDPSFLFKTGGGPALDMGPYYLAALVNLLGPMGSVYASARMGSKVRPVTAPERRVDQIDVSIPTHSSAVVNFASGAIATVMMSFDVWDHALPHIELYGTEGTLRVPDPNNYDDVVMVRLHGDDDWRVIPPRITGFTTGLPKEELPLRGPGVADLAAALGGSQTRCGAEFALHVLEALDAIASGTDGEKTLTTTCGRPAPTKETWQI